MALAVDGAHAHPAYVKLVHSRKPDLPGNAVIVLEALREAGRPLKAYGLLEVLRDKGVSAPMTVYRALDRLMADRFVRRVESQNAYMALPEGAEDQAIAFQICRQCGQTETVTLEDNPLGQLAANEELYIEIYHDCRKC